MNEDQLTQLAEQFVEIKVPFADAEFRKELSQEIREKMEETITLELISAMTPEQVEKYNLILENKKTTEDEILAFIKDVCNINIDVITSSALTRFRVAYIGA